VQVLSPVVQVSWVQVSEQGLQVQLQEEQVAWQLLLVEQTDRGVPSREQPDGSLRLPCCSPCEPAAGRERDAVTDAAD
jgi:hypothetical protein